MQSLQGIAVSPGVAIGEAFVIDAEGFRISQRHIPRTAIDLELQRLFDAIEGVAGELEVNREKISLQLGEQYGAIFAAHLQMLRDPHLMGELEASVKTELLCSELAVRRTFHKYAQVFRSLENSYIAQRADDLVDIENSLLARLTGQSRDLLPELDQPVIVLAHNLTPSETARLDPKSVLGFVTETGGLGGHTAIVAEALEIPAVVGAGKLLNLVNTGTPVIVDGATGRIIVEPDVATHDEYQNVLDQQRVHAEDLQKLRLERATTADNVELDLSANIEFPHEVDTCLERGADGVGLYRTEFLYLGSDHEPTEEEHFTAYERVVSVMKDRPVVIRTLDLGADKVGRDPENDPDERNPFLGLRSIRLSLRNLDQFRTQLRAILRASALGRVKVMFPLIATLPELRSAKMILSEVMEDLREEGIEFDPNLQVGMMVEVPSAVVMLDRFVREVDFVSIGTNDLVQYALAVDRGNEDVADLYRASDPAVLRLIRQCIQVADEADVEVSLCGQMCGNALYAMLLIGLGLRHMSVRPSALLPLKRICRQVTVEQCTQIAERVLDMDSAREVDRFLTEEIKKIAPTFTNI